MLKSKARRRAIAAKSAMAGALGAGAFLAVSVMANVAGADTKTVSYACAPPAAGSTTSTPQIGVTLTAPAQTPTINQGVPLTWVNGTPAQSPLVAPTAMVSGDRVVLEGEIIVTGPNPTATVTVKASGVATIPAVGLAQNNPLPMPTMLATVTPTASGTTLAKVGSFWLKVGSGVAQPTEIYKCTIATAGTNIQPASVQLVIGASASPTTPSSSPTTPTSTPTTPKPTITETKTKYVTPEQDQDADEESTTPKGGADTGGGGAAGPDGRMFVLVGSLMVGAAAIGGLFLRRRAIGR
ncbi:hypothetical protein SAMN05421505_14128 [Sinosporangium album]|uniref:LPXTG-motif cell wall anchor domain-containing protein n=1 Tax=Sinosporangium album TaxID=504805 RepID=A0A1G8J5P4_9ACTN|nr:hypothetical protein [Sinosporangium album]SDI26598.1 hypothetical protein SAMN05421505_14128 [Sinosporangium album]